MGLLHDGPSPSRYPAFTLNPEEFFLMRRPVPAFRALDPLKIHPFDQIRRNREVASQDTDVFGGIFTSDLFQAKLAIVLLDNPVALAGGVFKFLAVHDLHCATGVLDELLPLQNPSGQAHGCSICT